MEIEGFTNYLIYDDGRVWTKNKKKFMKPHTNKKTGYSQICLCKNGDMKSLYIHRLVAKHYIDNPNGYETVDHIDRNRVNNNVNNLRWATRFMQSLNTKLITNTGEKYITKIKRGYNEYYTIIKNNYFRTSLRCDSHSLQDAINLRDELLGSE